MTIKDALGVAQDLGVQFPWVDAVCIQQDDPNDMRSQIPNMDKIYGAARVTIVAGFVSDGWSGLLDVGDAPKLRSNSQSFSLINGLPFVTVLQPNHTWENNSTWNYRGWTFQEKFLTKRLLMFGDEQVYFECRTDLWF